MMSRRSKQTGSRKESSTAIGESRPAGLADGWTVLGVCLILVGIIWVVFGQTAHFGFVNCDDDVYVYDNAKVTGGLTLPGVAWVFTHAACNFYHPLTMISLMLDYQLHQLNAGGYHLTNVLIHAASAVLLFLILRRMTGALWRSAFVAAVFAIHPLRVESVAWVTERKDVLGAFFFMLTLGAYVRYVRDPNSLGRYLMVALFFAVGLLCKPTAVALPFLLLLLDYWPLHRFAAPMPTRATAPPMEQPGCCFGIPRRLILEKVPLLALAALASVGTYFAEGEAVTSMAPVPMPARIANVLVSYVVYLRQMVWPAGLTVFYPPVNHYPLWEPALAFLLLGVISGGVLAFWRKRPWLLVGWGWYLGMLVPVIGIIPVTPNAHPDRNTYLPQIGLYVLLAWAAADWSAGWKHRRAVLGGLMAVVIGALMACAHNQTSHWRNNETLWRYALACNSKNGLATYNLATALHDLGRLNESITYYQKTLEINPNDVPAQCDLGNALMEQGQTTEAIACFHKVLEIQPNYPEALYNLGNALVKYGNLKEAITQYRKALEISPDHAHAHYNLGNALAQEGDLEEAIAQYTKALEIHPEYLEAHYNLGNAFFKSGRLNEAIAQYKKVLELQPAYGGAFNNLGTAYTQLGRVSEAMGAYRKALDLQPENTDALNNLAWALATCPQAALRDGAAALALAKKAGQLTGEKNPLLLRTLAAAYAETGSYGMAAVTARRALDLAVEQKNDALAAALQKEIKLYQAGAPVRDSTIQERAPTVRDAPP